jgi:hypothetical protein
MGEPPSCVRVFVSCTRDMHTHDTGEPPSKHGCGCQVGTGEPPSCVRVFVSCTHVHAHARHERAPKQASMGAGQVGMGEPPSCVRVFVSCTRDVHTHDTSEPPSKHGWGCRVGTGEPPSCVHDCVCACLCRVVHVACTRTTRASPQASMGAGAKSARASPQVACACLCRARVTCTRTTRASPQASKQASKHGCGTSWHGRAPKLRARLRLCVFVPCRVVHVHACMHTTRASPQASKHGSESARTSPQVARAHTHTKFVCSSSEPVARTHTHESHTQTIRAVRRSRGTNARALQRACKPARTCARQTWGLVCVRFFFFFSPRTTWGLAGAAHTTSKSVFRRTGTRVTHPNDPCGAAITRHQRTHDATRVQARTHVRSPNLGARWCARAQRNAHTATKHPWARRKRLVRASCTVTSRPARTCTHVHSFARTHACTHARTLTHLGARWCSTHTYREIRVPANRRASHTPKRSVRCGDHEAPTHARCNARASPHARALAKLGGSFACAFFFFFPDNLGARWCSAAHTHTTSKSVFRRTGARVTHPNDPCNVAITRHQRTRVATRVQARTHVRSPNLGARWCARAQRNAHTATKHPWARRKRLVRASCMTTSRPARTCTHVHARALVCTRLHARRTLGGSLVQCSTYREIRVPANRHTSHTPKRSLWCGDHEAPTHARCNARASPHARALAKLGGSLVHAPTTKRTRCDRTPVGSLEMACPCVVHGDLTPRTHVHAHAHACTHTHQNHA